MADLLVLVDVSFLAWRAFYSTGHLRHNSQPTGIIYGVLREIKSLRDRFDTDYMAMCFDSPISIRRDKHPNYKASRRTNWLERKRQLAAIREQTEILRNELFKDLGFVNSFQSDGYEGDDLIASICQNYDDEKVIVSADSDLYQCLSKSVFMYNPREKVTTTHKSFKKKHGVKPSQWPMVKAIAGDATDNISGVYRVGVHTAVRYIKGELPTTGSSYKAIQAGQEIIQFNLPLVTLPYHDCPVPSLMEQPELDHHRWDEVVEKFGIKTVEI